MARGRRATLALAVELSRHPLVVRLGWGVAALTCLGAIVTAIVLGRAARADEGESALPSLVLVTSSALAYGAGVLVAFGGAAQALRRDRDEGIRALLAARATSTAEYLTARALGLCAVVGAPVVGGTLVAGLVAVAAAGRLGQAAETLRSLLAALAFAALFAALVSLVALASLGARSRAGGYVVLLGLLVAPEVLAPLTARLVPASFARLVSLPGALDALREGLSHDLGLAARAAAVLAACGLGLAALVRAELARLEAEGAP